MSPVPGISVRKVPFNLKLFLFNTIFGDGVKTIMLCTLNEAGNIFTDGVLLLNKKMLFSFTLCPVGIPSNPFISLTGALLVL
jgi:hypothetical protein